MITPLAIGRPVQPPGGPERPPGASNPCAVEDTFPTTVKGAAPVTRQYNFTDVGTGPWTIESVVLENTTGTWSLDASQLTGVLQVGESKVLAVTFTPPAK